MWGSGTVGGGLPSFPHDRSRRFPGQVREPEPLHPLQRLPCRDQRDGDAAAKLAPRSEQSSRFRRRNVIKPRGLG